MTDFASWTPNVARCCSGVASVEEGRGVLNVWNEVLDELATLTGTLEQIVRRLEAAEKERDAVVRVAASMSAAAEDAEARCAELEKERDGWKHSAELLARDIEEYELAAALQEEKPERNP